MNVQQARDIIKETIDEYVALCTSKGLNASGKVHYSDKTLRECQEFNSDIILIFGAVKFGAQDMDEEDYCTYGFCCETKVGQVNDDELEAEIANFKSELENTLEEITNSPSPLDKIREINQAQEEETLNAMQKFDLEMRKMKRKLYIGLGIFAIIAAVIIIVGFII